MLKYAGNFSKQATWGKIIKNAVLDSRLYKDKTLSTPLIHTLWQNNTNNKKFANKQVAVKRYEIGTTIDSSKVGVSVGWSDGCIVGDMVGVLVGFAVGVAVGLAVGVFVTGFKVGFGVGWGVGAGTQLAFKSNALLPRKY